MKLFSAAQMKELEKRAVQKGICYETLMENAGAAAVRFLLKKFSLKGKKIVILCGKGNNGGDGFVMARRLAEQEARVAVVLVEGIPVTDCADKMFKLLENSYIRIVEYSHQQEVVSALLYSADFIVDAIYGIGFHGKVSSSLEPLFEEASHSFAPVISIDIPSGAVCNTGSVNGVCIQAAYTVTFSSLKPAHLLAPAKDYCGDIHVAPIGIEGTILEEADGIFCMEDSEASRFFISPRKVDGHKGDFGDLLCICGSKGMAGAAVLSICAALRSGVGLVHAVLPESIYPIVSSRALEAVYTLLSGDNFFLSEQEKAVLSSRLASADACLIGCGLGTSSRGMELLSLCLRFSKGPVIIDADGINLLAQNIDILQEAKVPVILTPHPGEMARLTGFSIPEIQNNRLELARKFAVDHRVTLVLKGAGTVLAGPDGRLYLNTNGNAGMAKGGSGDALAGIIGALLARGIEPLSAAAAAVYLHGAVGDLCAQKKSQAAMLPSDMIEQLPEIFCSWSK